MSSPFLLLEKNKITRIFMEKQYKKRARQIIKRIGPFINKDVKILDVGTGTGYVAKDLIKRINFYKVG